jgi:preprotein translocase subunit YajC
MNGLIVMSILGVFLLFIFFVFLLLRRTTQEFKRGMKGE